MMLYVRVILCSLLLTNYALALLRSTMKDPVQLSVFRRPKSVNDTMIDTSSWPRGRSKGLMFQRILGISPGKPFVFNLDKWQALQHCGLFSNLTARSIAPTNDSVQLLVSGIERPSIVFAPELAVASTLTNPEVSGGLLFRNKNFRGLGETFELVVSQKGGLEEGANELDPVVKLKWTDCNIGKYSNVALSYEHNSFIDYIGNVYKEYTAHKMDTSYYRSPVTMEKISMLFRGIAMRKDLPSISYSMEPYSNLLRSKFSPAVSQSFTGAKMSIELLEENGLESSLWYDGGQNQQMEECHPFHHLGCNIALPVFNLFKLSVPNIMTKESKVIDIYSKLKFSVMRAWGKGCNPLFHFSSLDNPQLIRGIRNRELMELNTVKSLAGAKIDVYGKGLKFATVGMFSDICLFDTNHDFKATLAVGCGISVRSTGFRLDVGIDKDFREHGPKFHLGFDLGD